MKGTLKIWSTDEDDWGTEEQVEIDLKQKVIKSFTENASTFVELRPAAIDSKVADLCFFIDHSDVSFL